MFPRAQAAGDLRDITTHSTLYGETLKLAGIAWLFLLSRDGLKGGPHYHYNFWPRCDTGYDWT